MRLALKAKKMKEEKQEEENEGRRQRVRVQIQDVKGEEEEDEPPIEMNGRFQASWADKILLDRRIRFFVVMAVVAIIAPCLVWFFLLQPETEDVTIFQTCRHYDEFRIPCFEEHQSEQNCLQSHCCYNKETGECYHRFPSYYGMRFDGWKHADDMANEALVKAQKEGMPMVPKTPRTPDNVELMDALFTIRRKGNLLQLQIRSKSEAAPPQHDTGDLPYNVTLGEDFEVQVGRSDEPKKLLTTSMGPTLLGAAGRWDVVLQLPTNATILGAHADDASTKDTWLYPAPGRPVALPTLLAVEESGKATGVRLLTSAPLRLRLTDRNVSANLLQIRLLVPHPAQLTIEMAAADTPAEVLRVLMETDTDNGDKDDTQPVPDWALGFMMCPAQPPTEDVITIPDPEAACTRFQTFLKEAQKTLVPWDAHCVEQSLIWEQGTLECLNETDWAYIGERRLLAVLPNAIRDGETSLLPMMIAEEKNETYVGLYLGEDVRFPDWLAADNDTLQWATKTIRDAFGRQGSQRLGGVALIDNWPLDERSRHTSSEGRFQEWSTKDFAELDSSSQQRLINLWASTLFGMARHVDGGRHFNRHAYVPALQARFAATAVTQAAGGGAQAAFVLSDAAGPGIGSAAGVTGGLTHGEDMPSWASLRAAAVTALNLVAAGSAPLATGDPICGGGTGFDPKNESHLELCERWYQQAATLPLMWVASQPPHRHLTELPAQTRIRAAEAVRLRYELLPHLRTLVAAARVGGLPVARHLALEFPGNAAARAASANAPHAQWMLGAALLVAPAAAPKVATVEVFLPFLQEGNWRILFGGAEINTTNADKIYQNDFNDTIGHMVRVKLERTRPLLLIRPGFIIPLTASASAANATSVSEALSGGLHLTASASCTDECTAHGDLLLSATDAEPLTLHLIATTNNVTVSWNGSVSACNSSRREDQVIDDTGTGESTEGAAYVLQELDVYGVPTDMTSEDSVSVRSSNGTLLQDVNSRLIDGRLSLSSINLDFCTNVGMTALW